MLIVLTTLAWGTDLYPVRSGDTVETIAETLGDGRLADEIRDLNGIAAGAQPYIGQMLELPEPKEHHGEQKAFLITLGGSATMTDAAGTSVEAETWKPIPTGATVCTGAQSYATLRLASTCNDDGSLTDDIQLQPETCLRIDAAFSTESRRSSVVTVTRGSVRVQEAKSARGHITVVTPSGITTSKEGGFRVTIEPEAARTEALDAPVAVAGGGAEVGLNAGQGSRVKKGEAPSDPVDLLLTRALTTPDDGAILRKPYFAWAPVDKAFGYRLEIAPSSEFLELYFAEDVSDAELAQSVLMLPYDKADVLFWRVSTFDRWGFLGVPSDPRSLRLPTAR